MQSLLQYRRLPREVQYDILRTQQASRQTGSFTGASMNQGETAAPIDVEEQSQLGQIAEKSTPPTDNALFPGVKVL